MNPMSIAHLDRTLENENGPGGPTRNNVLQVAFDAAQGAGAYQVPHHAAPPRVPEEMEIVPLYNYLSSWLAWAVVNTTASPYLLTRIQSNVMTEMGERAKAERRQQQEDERAAKKARMEENRPPPIVVVAEEIKP